MSRYRQVTVSIAFVFIFVMLTVFSGCSAKKESSAPLSQKEDVQSVPEDGSAPENIVPEKEYSYDELREMLTAKLAEADYGDTQEMLFYAVLDALYENYPTWAGHYSDLPPVDRYIIAKLISSIDNIGSVTVYNSLEEAGEANNEDPNNPAAAWTIIDPRKEKADVYIIKVMGGDEAADGWDTELFYHELIHACMMDSLGAFDYGGDYAAGYYEILTEGAASFHMRFVNEYTAEVYGSWMIGNDDYYIDYQKENGDGYLIALNDYEKIRYLVGYGVLHSYENNLISKEEVIKSAETSYDPDDVKLFFDMLGKRYTTYLDTGYLTEGLFELSVKIENQFLEFIKQDMENASDKKELDRIIREYEYYVEKNLPRVHEKESGKDVTEEFFDLISADNYNTKP